MANQQDLVRLLTGISSTQQPVQPAPVAGSKDFAGMFGAQQAAKLSGGIQNLARGGAPSPQQNIASAIGNIDLKSAEGLRTMAKVKQIQGDINAANTLNQQAVAMEEKVERAKNIAGVVEKEIPNRPDLVKLAKSGDFTLKDLELFRKKPKDYEPLFLTSQTEGSIGNITLNNGKVYLNGNEISEQEIQRRNLSITKTYSKKPTGPAVTKIDLGDKINAIQYKIDAEATGKMGEDTRKQAEQYLPVIQNMIDVSKTAEFGAGTSVLASANNVITSLSNQFGIDLQGSVEKDATQFFNANSKLLKQRLLEATKGAISNLENTEITKNTANTEQPKQVAMALLNSQKASLTSKVNQAAAMDSYLRTNKSLGGFDQAWRQYIEMFPRTAGYHVAKVKDPVTGETTEKVVNNFETAEGNYGLFEELYSYKTDANKLRQPVTFVSTGGVTDTLDNLKKAYRQKQADMLAIDADVDEPSKAMYDTADRRTRLGFGAYLKANIDSNALRVVR